jgi:hypothetical protein
MSTANDNADVSPLFLESRPGMRKRIAAAVDALVALLDQIDGDADLEEDNPPEDDAPAEDVGDEEPSLGSVASRDASTPQYLWAQGADDDREREDEHDEEGGDEEPTLGATTALNQRCAWAAPRGWLLEDGEPSLGWTGHGRGHPEMALRGYDDDRERTTGPRDEEGDDADDGELDAESMDPWFNPPHLPGGNGATRRTGR